MSLLFYGDSLAFAVRDLHLIAEDPGDRFALTRLQLEIYRRRLLDLTGRNRFLNFVHRETARAQLRLVDTSLSDLFGLFESQEPLPVSGLRQPQDLLPEKFDVDAGTLDDELPTNDRPFKAARGFDQARVAEAARHQGVNPAYDLADLPLGQGGAAKKKLQSLLFSDQLHRRLQAIQEESKRYIQELGINTLGCCMGFLEWYESEQSERPRLAPLLVYPLDIDRVLVRSQYEYRFLGIGDDLKSNPSLIERLAQDFAIRLPEVSEGQPVSDYLDAIERDIAAQKRWKVRRMATICLLNFAKLALYHDLDPAMRPPHAAIEAHPIVSDLLTGVSEQAEPVLDNDENVDDPAIAARVPLLVTEADSSQFAAIADSLSRQSLVIEGPPGTGKSQTITNIIAASLAKGERVLFIADKLAALEVVKTKLDHYGLGAFCLELHSTKSRKTDVLASLRERISMPGIYGTPHKTLVADLQQQRALIQGYLDALHSTFGNLGTTVHALLWREQKMRIDLSGDTASLEDIVIPNAVDFDEQGISATSYTLAGYEATYKSICEQFGSIPSHPWYGIDASDYSLPERQALIARMRTYQSQLDALLRAVSDFCTGFGYFSVITIGEALGITRFAEQNYGVVSTLDASALSGIRIDNDLPSLEAFAHKVARKNELVRVYGFDLLNSIVGRDAAIDNALRRIDPKDAKTATLESLDSYVMSIQSTRGEALRQLEYVHGLKSLLGSASPQALQLARETARYLADVEPATLLCRYPTLLSERTCSAARDMARRGQQLVATDDELKRKFDVECLSNASSLKEMCRSLREAGPFWFVRSDVRAARTLFKRSDLSHRSPQNQLVEREFMAVANHLQSVDDFEHEVNQSGIFGPASNGLRTDFERILRVIEFGADIAKLVRGAGADANALRQIAFEQGVEQIDEFVSLMGDPRMELLAMRESVDVERAIASEIESTTSRVEALMELRASLDGVAIEGKILISSLREILQTAREYETLRLSIAEDGAAKNILASEFERACNDSSEVERSCKFIRALDASMIPAELKRQIAISEVAARTRLIQSLGDAARSALSNAQSCIVAIDQERALNTVEFFGAQSITVCEAASVTERLSVALQAADTIEDWLKYSRLRQAAVVAAGSELVTLFERGELEASISLVRAFEYLVVRSVVRIAIDTFPALRNLAGVALEEARFRFKELDERLLRASRMQLGSSLSRNAVEPGSSIGKKSSYTGLALIKNEIQKVKRHISVRDLVQRSGNALQQLKPCFMMSPLSVAQFIPAGSVEFDLIVIDEASQMRPEDALAALSRGKRVVVVGDRKQLPPTSFFDRQAEDEDVSEEDAVDNESVLDLALAQYGRSRRLRWHYRSTHQSLIAFSNRHFYDDDLIVMPSPYPGGSKVGVKSTYVQSVYSSGKNVGEAEELVEQALRFMRTEQSLSLGIVAVNRDQRDLINEMLERRVAEDPDARNYVSRHEGTLHPLFVKNLESVQGDERDVMFISTVYGPEEIGGRVAQRFGPILGVGGWRRLNVLFTRARVRVELFTSMRPSDVIVEEGRSSRGVIALRDYLEYAATGRLEAGISTRRPPDSDFEIAVARMLTLRGFDVEPQVGVANYFIDMAVRHPRRGGFMLGIECDGATYHSARSARDRDRTREEALGRLGWSLYRIWSTDWFANPRRESEKLIAHLNELNARLSEESV